MKKSFTMKGFLIFMVALLCCSQFSWAQTSTTRFNDGYITVFKNTSTTTLGSTGTAIVVEEYLPTTAAQSSPNFSVFLPTTGTTKLVAGATTSSNGAITRSENGRYLIVPGFFNNLGDANGIYIPAARTVDAIGNIGTGVQAATTTSWFTAGNDYRGAASDDASNFWMSGGTKGILYTNNGTSVTNVSTAPANTRVVQIFNGQLFFSTSSGTNGIYQVGTGKPTASGTGTTIQAPATAPYGFSVSPDGLTIYTCLVNSVVKSTYSGTYNASTFTYSGGAWSAVSTVITTLTGVTGVAVDWTGYSFSSTAANGAKIYACNTTTLVTCSDNGTSASSVTTLRTLTGFNIFKQIAFSPIKQTVSLGSNTPATGGLPSATVDASLFQLNLSADEGNSTLKKLIVGTSGNATISTSAGSADVSTFKLIDDVNNNGIYDAGETILSTGTVSGTTIIFSGINLASYIAQGNSKNLLVVGTVSNTAIAGHTLSMSIASTNTINSIAYSSNVTNAGGSLVTMGTGASAPTSNTLTIAGSTSISTSAISPASYCSGTSVTVLYTASGSYNVGNIFSAQLSDASGSFTSPINLTTTVSSTGSITATIPIGQSTGTGYRIRVVASDPVITGTDNGNNITITTLPAATISYSAASFCTSVTAGQSATITGTQSGTFNPVSGLSITSAGVITPSTSTAGSYTVIYTMTATGACSAQTASTSVQIIANPTVAVTPSAPSYCQGGSVLLTASGATSYTWSPALGLNGTTGSSVTASPTVSSSYSVSGTLSGCTSSTNVTVTVNSNPAAICSHTNATSAGGTEGSVSVSATGGSNTYSYLWTGGSTSSTVTNLGAGTYTVTVTDGNGCTASCSTTIIESLALTANCSVNNNVTCNGGNDGSVSVVASNGTGPYTYLWSNNSTSSTLTGLAAGTYTVTVTDAVNATANCQVTITEPATYTATAGSNSSVCEGLTLNLSATSSSTITPNTFAWTGPNGFSATGATPNISNVTSAAAGVYTVTATNGNGCTSTATTTVVINPAITVSVTPSSPSICLGLNTTLTASGANTYTWSPATGLSSTTGSIVAANPTITTTYTVTGTSTSGCTNSTTVTVTVNPLPTITVTPIPNVVCTGGSSVLTASGASTYSWSPSSTLSASTGNPVTATPTSAITYTIIGTDVNGCTSSTTTSLTTSTISNPTAVTALATGVSGTINITWTNPTSCVDEIMIVAAPDSLGGVAPTGNGSVYNADLTYGNGSAIGNGFVVYKGTTSPQSIIGLTNASRYFFKLYTRSGNVWSGGTFYVNAIPYVTASVSEIILPQYAINGTTTGDRMHYACRLQIGNLSPNSTYRYTVGASNVTTITTGTAAGNMYAINNTSGASGYITGYTSSKSMSGSLLNGNGFLGTPGYAQFTTDSSGNYTGWFAFVATGNAAFTNGNNVYLYVQLNGGTSGANDTNIVQSVHTTNTIKMISEVSPASSARALKGSSFGVPENMIFLYDNANGTGRPIAGTWIENDGITTNYTVWYNAVDGVNGRWGAYIPTALPNGIRRVEQRNVATGNIAGCADSASAGVWVTAAGNVNTVNPSFGTSALFIDSIAAPLTCPILNTIATSTSVLSGTTFCIDPLNGAAITVPFTSTYPFNSGNIFTAQLSNASGSFASPVTIGTLSIAPAGNYSDSIFATIPAGTLTGTGYRIRVVSSDPAIIGTNNGTNITITGGTTFYADNDFDGYGDDFNTTIACVIPDGYVSVGGDCDDFDDQVHSPLPYYVDGDGDGYGAGSVTTICSSTAPSGYSINNTDCNDLLVGVNPGATEVCNNGIDDNCNGSTDEGCTSFTYFLDNDNDGYGDATIFITSTSTTIPAGYVINSTDCNDNNANIHPGATEICNGIDDNCNGLTDDGLTFINYYADNDNDTYGGALIGNLCTPPTGSYVLTGGDCNDANAAVHPGANELCNNGIDDNCDGNIDETTLAATESHTTISCFGGTSTVTIGANGGVLPYSGTGVFTQSAGSTTYTVTDALTCTSAITVSLTQPTAISITSFSPAVGQAGGTITITGAGFSGATVVTINGLNVASFTVTNDNQITAIVPSGATSGLIAITKGTCTVSTTTSFNIASMTELVVPRYMGSKSAAALNNTRTPIAVCVQFDNLVPNTTYNVAGGIGLISDASSSTGAGNIWNGTAFSGSSITNAFTTNASGSSGPYWIYFQPTGNASRFGAGQIHNLRISYYTGATAPGSPSFVSTKTITALDIATTPLTTATTDDGAFITGTLDNCMNGKHVLIYDNVAGTGDPLFSTFADNGAYTNTSQPELPTNINKAFTNTGGSGAFAAVYPIGANSNLGVQRVETRNALNVIVSSATAAGGIWPSGLNTTNAVVRDSSKILTNADASLNTISSLTTTTTSVACFGNSTGSATASAISSATPVSYNWASGSSLNAIYNNLVAGAYSVTATDTNGCIKSATAIITQPTAGLVASETHTTILIAGGTSTVTVTATGGTGAYSYSDGTTTNSTGVFTQFVGSVIYTVTDANGCTSSVTTNITEPSSITVTESHTAINCNGGSSTVTVSASGGVGPYTGTGTFTQLAGSHTYNVTDANGATGSVIATITQPTAVSVTESHTAIVCFGGSSTVTISASGGTGTLTGTGTFTQTAGTTSYTVTDANGCTGSVSVTLTNPTQIIVSSFVPTLGQAGTSVVITGSGFTGATAVLINGVNVPTFTVNSATQITLTVPAGASSGFISVTNGGCTVASTAIFNVVTFTELVIPKYMGAKTSASTNNDRTPVAFCIQFDHLAANTIYNISAQLALTSDAASVTGAGNCWSGTAFTNANQLNAFTTNASGSSGPVWIYIQPTGNATRFGAGQVHNLRVSYFTGASAPGSPQFISTRTITALDIPTTASTPATTDDGAFLTGALDNCMGGKYVLIYDNTSGTGDPLFATAAKTMPFTNTTQSDLPTTVNSIWLNSTTAAGTFAAVIPIGANNSNGVRRVETRSAQNVILNAATSLTGIWPSGANTTTATRRAVITLTNADASLNTISSLSTTTTPVLCNGGNTGSATAAATTLATPNTISYLWNPGSVAGASLSNLTAATYTVTVTDANGCTKNTTAVVSQPTALSASETHTAILCNGGSSTVTITGNGGTAPYSGTGNFTQTAGTQSYTIHDANGCDYTFNVTVTQPNAIVITSLSPATGAIGSSVVISGSGFTGATGVSFNGTNTTYSVDNDGQITATVPTGATTGTVTVNVGTCSGNSSTPFIVSAGTVTLNLKLYLQGYYVGGGLMTPALYNQGISSDPTEVDSITVELHDNITGQNNLVESNVSILKTNGTMQLQFSPAILTGSYYIVVKQRNSVETWSKLPVTFTAVTNYDFSN